MFSHERFDADCKVLGVSNPPSEVDVHAAFRRRAHSLHPDRNRSASSHAAFCELSDAKDRVLAGLPGAKDRAPVGRAGAKDRGSVLMQMIEAIRWVDLPCGALALMEALPRALSAAGCDGACALAREVVSSKIARHIRTVRLTATLRNLLAADVYVWRGGRTLFIPLWHEALYFEDERVLFVVTRALPANVTVDASGDIVATVGPGEALVVDGVSYGVGVHVGAPVPSDDIYAAARGVMRVVASGLTARAV